MKTNYSETVEIDILEEPQLDFKYYKGMQHDMLYRFFRVVGEWI